jgi:hypothetical protein
VRLVGLAPINPLVATTEGLVEFIAGVHSALSSLERKMRTKNKKNPYIFHENTGEAVEQVLRVKL